jgi:hypothetical protein
MMVYLANYMPRLALNLILLISASRVARITDVSYQCLARDTNLFKREGEERAKEMQIQATIKRKKKKKRKNHNEIRLPTHNDTSFQKDRH